MTAKKTAAKTSKTKTPKSAAPKQRATETAPKAKSAARKRARSAAKQTDKAGTVKSSTKQPAPAKQARKSAKKTQTGAKKAKQPAKKSAPKKTKQAANGLSAEREQLLRKSARRKNGSPQAAAIAQERARQALESISVIRHDQDGDATNATLNKKRYTQRELNSFRNMLLRVRAELVEQVQSLRTASLTRDDEVNSEEDGTDAFERQLALQLASDEGDSIFEIDEALQRIDEGTYGICQECGCLVGRERLKALPFTRLCIECRAATEKHNHNHARRPMV